MRTAPAALLLALACERQPSPPPPVALHASPGSLQRSAASGPLERATPGAASLPPPLDVQTPEAPRPAVQDGTEGERPAAPFVGVPSAPCGQPPSGPFAVDPPCGFVLVRHGGHAEISTGTSGALVSLPPPRPHRHEGSFSHPVVALAFPIGRGLSRMIVEAAQNEGEGAVIDKPRFLRLRDEVGALACEYWTSASWFCMVHTPFGPDRTGRSFGFPDQQYANVDAWDAATFDGTVFVAALSHGRLIGFVSREDGTSERGLLGSIDSFHLDPIGRVLVHALDPSRATVTWVNPDGAFRVEMNAHGAAERRPVSAPKPAAAAPGVRVEVTRRTRREPHLVAARDDGELVPIGGIDPAAPTFSPAFARDETGWVLVWSEGLRTATRIRAARFDPAGPAVVGGVTEISTAGREAGSAAIDAWAGHVVVAWDEKNGSAWEVHAAELLDRPSP